MGYRLEGEFPNVKKLVFASAPHTSNWDLLLAIATILSTGVQINFMMKKEAFENPLGFLFKRIGGIAVDRSNPKRVVVQTLKAFKNNEKMWLAILPEGTRKPVKNWKAGYIRIAHAADVPIFFLGLDARTKTLHLDCLLKAGEDAEKQAEDMRLWAMGKYYGMNPENH